MSTLITRRIPFYALLISFLAGGFVSYSFYHNSAQAAISAPVKINTAKEEECETVSTRLKGYNYIKPLLFSDQTCESARFTPIKNAVDDLINSYKLSGDITSASVYLRDFDNAKWMGINTELTYHPASLIKIPILMTILRMSETNPGILDKVIVYDDIPKSMIYSKQNYIYKPIEQGKKYTVRELLRYMISYSDNNAQILLVRDLKPTDFDKMFIDFGIGLPMDPNSNQILITAKDYSVFIRALYNASYLNRANSEFALSLMKDCDFQEGFKRGLPADVKVVHKFAEYDDNKNFELHESGIIYIQNKAYLLTVMTRGDNGSKLPGVLGSITKTIYTKINNLAVE